MFKFKKFLIDNADELLFILLLFVIFSILTMFFRHQFGNVIIDNGREAYFPAEMLKGKVLYKDLFNIFGPLSYQINAFFYSVFGISLRTLRFAGFLNSGLIILLLYSLARMFVSKGTSWIITLFIISSCMFIHSFFNYIFPYAYAIVYAFSSFLLSVLFLLMYLKKDKDYLLMLSWFFIGISFASKYEYVLYIFLLLFISLVKNMQNKKIMFLNLVSFSIIPLLSYSVLFIQGLSLQEFLSQIHLIKIYTLSPSLGFMYANAGFYPQSTTLLSYILAFKHQIIFLITLLGSLYFLFSTSSKDYTKKLASFFVACLSCYLFSFSIMKISTIFCWLPLFTLLIFILLFLKLKGSTSLKDFISTKDGIYLIFVACAILSSLKTFFKLNLYAYGTFTLPLLIIASSIFLVEYLPRKFGVINKVVLKKSFASVMLILTVPFLLTFFLVTEGRSEVISQRGALYDSKETALVSKLMIDYINNKLKPEDTIWVIPEGTMINFLTNHPSTNIYYASNTPYIEAFGENKIIADTKKNPPNYIIVTNQKSACYGYNYFCKDYGFKICSYVKSDYEKVAVFGSEFKMILYKYRAQKNILSGVVLLH